MLQDDGLIFLGGTIGVEMISAAAADAVGTDNVLYSSLYTVDELLEMLGIVLFLYALFCHLAEETGGLVLRVSMRE